MSPERLIAEQRPPSVRITTSGGDAVTLRRPIILNDSIVSTVTSVSGRTFAPSQSGIATRDIRSIDVERFSAGRTIAFAAGIAAIAIGWASVAGDSEGGSTIITEPPPKGVVVSLWRGSRLVVRVGR